MDKFSVLRFTEAGMLFASASLATRLRWCIRKASVAKWWRGSRWTSSRNSSTLVAVVGAEADDDEADEAGPSLLGTHSLATLQNQQNKINNMKTKSLKFFKLTG